MTKIDAICIDIEASGLGSRSYPIEIAWKCSRTGRSDEFFINPDSGYEWTDWDEQAAQIHNISPQLLRKQGISVQEACVRLNTALDGSTVVSDALEFDFFWMQRLFDAAMLKPTFSMAGIDMILEGEQMIMYRLVAKAQVRRHRAMSDVEDLLTCLAACEIDAGS